MNSLSSINQGFQGSALAGNQASIANLFQPSGNASPTTQDTGATSVAAANSGYSLSFSYSYFEASAVSIHHGHKVLAHALQAHFEGFQLNGPAPQAAPQASYATQQQPTAPSSEQVANRVLGFINQRLQKEADAGASPERLSTLLQQASDGVAKGFADAKQVIDKLGLTSDALTARIDDSYSKIQSGLQDLAQQFAITAPTSADTGAAASDPAAADSSAAAASVAPADAADTTQSAGAAPAPTSATTAPAAPQTDSTPVANSQGVAGLDQLSGLLRSSQLQGARSSQLNASAEQVGIQIKTQDGDVVTINLQQVEASYTSSSFHGGHHGRHGSTALSGQYAQGQYSFSVDGQLDQGEVQAVGDLLGQIQNLADQFFHGDLGAAFNTASQLGFDSTELASFSVNLSQSTVSASTQKYRDVAQSGQPAPAPTGSSAIEELRKYAQELTKSLASASVFSNSQDFLGSLFDQLFSAPAPAASAPADNSATSDNTTAADNNATDAASDAVPAAAGTADSAATDVSAPANGSSPSAPVVPNNDVSGTNTNAPAPADNAVATPADRIVAFLDYTRQLLQQLAA